MAPANEALLVRTAAQGDAAAFGELVRTHQSQVRGFLRQLTGDPAQADDLAQDTFMRAWDKLASYSGRGRLSAWLMRLAYNVFLQSVRKSKQDRRLLERLESEAAAGETGDQKDAGSADGEWVDLPRLLSVLSQEERQVMTLGYAWGMSHGEIGEVAGLALGTVKSHIRRGKAKIRERFGLEGVGDE